MSQLTIHSVKPQDSRKALLDAINIGKPQLVRNLLADGELNRLNHRSLLIAGMSYSYLDRAEVLLKRAIAYCDSPSAGPDAAAKLNACSEIVSILKAAGAKTGDEIKKDIRSRQLVPSAFFRTNVGEPELFEC